MLLITGSEGQLGSVLRQLLPDALATNASQLDITSAIAVNNFVRENNITTIINCAAYTAVDAAQSNEEQAKAVNHIGAANLACTGATIIHISTDYVFSGNASNPYTELDLPAPCSVYGATKLAGEQAVLATASSAIVIRTSWLYAANKNNFVNTMLRLSAEREQIRVVADQVGSPTAVFDLAHAIVAILPQIIPKQRLLYHYANSGYCSWFEFAQAIIKLSNSNCQIVPISSSEYRTAAARPNYSVLCSKKISKDFNLHINHWHDALTTFFC